MRPYPDAGKALRQLTRRDLDKVNQYRAELKYFHVPQRAILGMTTAYSILDEIVTWTLPPKVWPHPQQTPSVPHPDTHPHALPPP